MTSYAELVERLRQNGYGPSRSADRWGVEVWSRKGCPGLRVESECSAAGAERVLVQMATDMATAASKRKPKKFRLRETAARKAEARDKRRREDEAHAEARNRELGGLREHLTADEAHRIQFTVEKEALERRETVQLMTSIPGARADAGRPRAKHRA